MNKQIKAVITDIDETLFSHKLKKVPESAIKAIEEMQAKVKLKEEPDWVELEKLKLEAEAIGFYLSAHPLDSYRDGMEKLGVKSCSEVFRNIQVGDVIRAKLAGCVNGFKKKVSQKGNRFAFLELSDASGSFEGIVFSETLQRSEEMINSGLPLLASVTIERQAEEGNPKVMISNIETLDKAIADVASAIIINISNIAAVRPVKEILGRDKKGLNKVYIKPDNDEWDITIELQGGYAFSSGNIISQLRSVPGVSSVKEI